MKIINNKMPFHSFFRNKITKFIFFTAVILVISLQVSYYIISFHSNGLTFDSVDQIEKHKVGLLLGTSKFLKDGRENLFFKHRIVAAAALYKSNKIEIILISGDNSQITYNEPQDMKNDLILLGVPAEKIHLDYAGFRTLDAIVRAKKIFGQDSFIVISQKFHNERAIFIANHFGVKSIGFNAKDVSFKIGFKTKVRERLSRIKVFYDILFNVHPKYYGEKIYI